VAAPNFAYRDIGLDPEIYGTCSLRRTKAIMI